jgi:urease accessory protein
VPLGQSAGQRILAQLAQELATLAATSLTLGDAQRQAFAPLLAIRSSQHETQYSRLFRS